MAFSGKIDCLLHPSLFKVVPEGQPLALSQLASSAESMLPSVRRVHWHLFALDESDLLEFDSLFSQHTIATPSAGIL